MDCSDISAYILAQGGDAPSRHAGQKCQPLRWFQGRRLSLLLHIFLMLLSTIFIIVAVSIPHPAVGGEETRVRVFMGLTAMACVVFGYVYGVMIGAVARTLIAQALRGDRGATGEGVLALASGVASLSPLRLASTGQILFSLAWFAILGVQALSASTLLIGIRMVGDGNVRYIRIDSLPLAIVFMTSGAVVAVVAIVLEIRLGKEDIVSGSWLLLSILDPDGRMGMCAYNESEANAFLRRRPIYLRDVAGDESVGHLQLVEEGGLPVIRQGRRYAGLLLAQARHHRQRSRRSFRKAPPSRRRDG